MKPLAHLEIQYIKTDELLEYPSNAKLHPSMQIDQIAASIEEFNFNNPILAWHNDEGEAEIVAGHGRLMAARRLGIEELPVVFLDHLSDEARRAYLLVDNQLTMNTGFDADILKDELDAITEIDMGQFDFSFEVPSIDDEFMGDSFEERKQPEVKNTSEEIDLDDFDDERFEHECPRCGFRFNE